MSDLIKREDATETFAELYDIFDDYPNIVKELHKVYDKILAIPSAENKGEWITDIYKLGKERHRCSECGKGSVEDSNYCPNCGARMKGVDDERTNG